MTDIASARVRETLAVATTVTLAAFLIYWLPQYPAGLPSDVTWIYRLQVRAPEAIGQVPAGLDLFTGAPMGWGEACLAHYEAFKRLNCGDIIVWRLFALIADESAPIWLALTLAINIAMVVLVDIALRHCSATWLMRLVAICGLMILPVQTWMTPLTSEPRVGLALAGAIVAAISGRHMLAAFAMALTVAFKEPSIVWWPFIAALSLTAPERPERPAGYVARLAPHAALAATVTVAGLGIWFLAEARNNYPFLVTTPRPEILPYIGRALEGMSPALVGPQIIWAIPLGVAILLAGAWRQSRLGPVLKSIRRPSWWLPILAGLVGIAGHVAVHWLTRREIGDTRYLVPGNIVLVFLIALALRPLMAEAGRHAMIAAGAIICAAVTINLWSPYAEIHALSPLVAVPAAIAGIIVAYLPGGRRRLAAGLAAGFATGWLLTDTVDYRMRLASDDLVDSQSWHQAVDEFLDLPENAWVLLRTTDPLMIETVWSVQAEMLFAGQNDIAFRVEPADTSFYASETGLVKGAHDAFNATAPTLAQAKSDGRPVYTVNLARNGRAGSVPGPTYPPLEWLKLAITRPAAFWQQRYHDGKAGYLVWQISRITDSD